MNGGHLARSEEIVRRVVMSSDQDLTYMTLDDVRAFVAATQDFPGGTVVSALGRGPDGFFTAITATHREEVK